MPDPAPPPLRLASFLPYRVSVAAERISRAFADRYEAEFGLSIPEWRVMAILGEESPLPTREVIARTAMDRVRVSRAAIGLADRDLIAGAPVPGDQRARLLRLTPAGRALYLRIVPRAHALHEELAAVLGDGEEAVLLDLLHRLGERAMRLRDDGKPSPPVDEEAILSIGRCGSQRYGGGAHD